MSKRSRKNRKKGAKESRVKATKTNAIEAKSTSTQTAPPPNTSQITATKPDGTQEVRAAKLVFSHDAWRKLKFMCHKGGTEVGGFGLAADPNDPLYITDLLMPKQKCTAATVAFDDDSVADLFEDQLAAGFHHPQFARIWWHTHPGSSPHPSNVDETTFREIFGRGTWAVMFILAKGGATYCRLTFFPQPGFPGHTMEIPVEYETEPNVIPKEWEDLYVATVETERGSWPSTRTTTYQPAYPYNNYARYSDWDSDSDGDTPALSGSGWSGTSFKPTNGAAITPPSSGSSSSYNDRKPYLLMSEEHWVVHPDSANWLKAGYAPTSDSFEESYWKNHAQRVNDGINHDLYWIKVLVSGRETMYRRATLRDILSRGFILTPAGYLGKHPRPDSDFVKQFRTPQQQVLVLTDDTPDKRTPELTGTETHAQTTQLVEEALDAQERALTLASERDTISS